MWLDGPTWKCSLPGQTEAAYWHPTHAQCTSNKQHLQTRVANLFTQNTTQTSNVTEGTCRNWQARKEKYDSKWSAVKSEIKNLGHYIKDSLQELK